MKFTSDIDIDFADRDQALALVKHVSAAIRTGSDVRRHNTGVYVTDIPTDPVLNIAALDYREAEDRGYIKLDMLNVWLYKHVKSEQHLQELLREPTWYKLKDRELFEQLIHLRNHYETLRSMPEPVDSVPRLAMFLSVIRPGKRHLIGKPWAEVAKTIWQKPDDGSYYFKQSHAIAYAHLVVLHMNLLEQDPTLLSLPE